MNTRSRRLVELALQVQESDSDGDDFSSFDSDADPLYLPESDEECLESSNDDEIVETQSKRRKMGNTSIINEEDNTPKVVHEKVSGDNDLDETGREVNGSEDDNFENESDEDGDDQNASDERDNVGNASEDDYNDGSVLDEVDRVENLSNDEGDRVASQASPSSSNGQIQYDEAMPMENEIDELDTANDDNNNENIRLRSPLIIHSADHVWTDPVGNHQHFEYTPHEAGIAPNFAAALMADLTPYNCFRLLLDDVIIDELVQQTNLYATQTLIDQDDIGAESRLHKWTPVDRYEMLRFIGIIGYMGLVQMPSIENYWSRDDFFRSNVIPKIMSRNRFQLLLRMWHFSDNEACPENDRLYKIKPLLDNLLINYQKVYTPRRTYCIDESIIPFQGRLIMKQYIPNKTHKYGVKLFKLCSENGYTWNIRIYAGKERDGTASVATNVVINLSQGLLNTGRTIVADNYYTSLELVNILLDNKTHYVGTLRSNRKGNPKEVTQKKLQKGEVFGLENERGVCIFKWRDKREVLMLSTKHTTETVEVARRTGVVSKPKAIMEYNEGKSSIDLSDQMSSYGTALRKSLRWYKKLGTEFIFGTTLVNAWVIYNQLSAKKMKINSFREDIVRSLFAEKLNEEETVERQVTTPTRRPDGRRSLTGHKLLKKEGLVVKTRRYCSACYKKKILNNTSKNVVKKVNTYCTDFPNEPHFCLPCFNEFHH